MADLYRKNSKAIGKNERDNFDFEFGDNGDVTLTMKHITVKDFEGWSDIEPEFFLELTASMMEVEHETRVQAPRVQEKWKFGDNLKKLRTYTFGKTAQ